MSGVLGGLIGSVVVTSVPNSIRYLVIAGGGGTFRDEAVPYGGGGAGGYRCSMPGENSGANSPAEPAFALTINTLYLVTIGAGGSRNGSNSTFGSVISIGGGVGGYDDDGELLPPGNGGSGGGGALSVASFGASGLAGQGFAGGDGSINAASGNRGGGGGGAGGTGQLGGLNTGGNGGTGIASSITGSSVFRAGGGAGGASNLVGGFGGTGGGGSPGSNGAINTGGGGGINARGGSGVVILRYPNTLTITLGSGLIGSTTTVGSDRVTTITAGTGNVSWAA